MGMTRTINIDGIDVAFKASAAIPRIYRLKFQRDIYKDISQPYGRTMIMSFAAPSAMRLSRIRFMRPTLK